MFNRNLLRKTLASCSLVAVWCVSSMVALAAVDGGQVSSASITVSGTVTINDRAAISNSTLVSGSTVTTGESADSVATVDMGKLGRVELLSQSSLVLKFDDNGIYGTLLVGKVRVMNMSGVTTTVATKEGIVIGDTRQANTFTVETECGRTAVNLAVGFATLRAEGQDRQVAAGTEAVAGNLQQAGCRPCLRPDLNSSFPSVGFLPVLLPILIGVGVGTALIVKNKGNNVETGGGGIIVSLNR
ncbi:MAG: hypothetical protein ABI954_14390 [Pyrinomonadaceae bacterium]